MKREPDGLLSATLRRVLPIAIIVLIVASLIVSAFVHSAIRSQAEDQLVESSELAARLVAQRLEEQSDFCKVLSLNALLINSLVDFEEREQYLPLFFRSLNAPRATKREKSNDKSVIDVEISMTDYRGRLVVSNNREATKKENEHEESPWLAAAMDGKEYVGFRDGRLTIASPITYADRPEGMIVLSYDDDSTKKLLDIDFPGYHIVVRDQRSSILSALPMGATKDHVINAAVGDTNQFAGLWLTRAANVPPLGDENVPLDLDIVLFRSLRESNDRIDQLNRFLALSGLLSIFGLVIGTLITVQMTVKPLNQFISQMQETRVSGDLAHTLDPGGSREFQTLGQSFNDLMSSLQETMVSRDQLEEANTDLERSNKELEQFAYVASHDLQEPLRKVSSFCQLLEQDYGDKIDGDGKRYMTYVVDGAERMRRLIRDLLAFSRVGSQGISLSLVASDVALNDALENLSGAIEESGAKISSQPLPNVVADKFQLTQLFQNLIGNAIKYRKDVAPEIVIAADENAEQWILSVTDNGIGIDPAFCNKIFGVFKRLHSREEYDGTGIGLAICQRIVDRLDGRIWVESRQGEGATFFVAIPKRDADSINEQTTKVLTT